MKIISKFPVIGSLPEMPWKAHKEAIVETAITVFFAALPIIFPPLLGIVFFNLNSVDYLWRLIGEGELLLYSAAFVGPFIYSIFKSRAIEQGAIVTRRRLSIEFPNGMSIVITSILICMAASLFFGFARLPPSGAHIESNHVAMLEVSALIYLVSIICFYSSTVYRNDLDDASSIVSQFRRQEDDFTNRWIDSHEP